MFTVVFTDMTKAVWISLLVFLTHAVPLQHVYTPVLPLREHNDWHGTTLLQNPAHEQSTSTIKLQKTDAVDRFHKELESSVASVEEETEQYQTISNEDNVVYKVPIDSDFVKKIQGMVDFYSNPDPFSNDTFTPNTNLNSDQARNQDNSDATVLSKSLDLQVTDLNAGEREDKAYKFDKDKAAAGLRRKKREVDGEYRGSESFDQPFTSEEQKVTLGRDGIRVKHEDHRNQKVSSDEEKTLESAAIIPTALPPARESNSDSRSRRRFTTCAARSALAPVSTTQTLITTKRDNTPGKISSLRPSSSADAVHMSNTGNNLADGPVDTRSESKGDVAVDNLVENAKDSTTDTTAHDTVDNTADTAESTPYQTKDRTTDTTAHDTVGNTSDTAESTPDQTKDSTTDNISNNEVDISTKRADSLLEQDIGELPASPYTDKSSLQKYLTCEHVRSFYSPRWLWMVTDCPESWIDSSVRERCRAYSESHTMSLFELLVSLPVQDSSGTVYANEFCANCQGVTSPLAWKAQVGCKETNSLPHIPTTLNEFPEFNSQLSNYFAGPDCETHIQPALPMDIKDCQAARLMPGYQAFWPGQYTRVSGRSGSSSQDSFGIPFTILFNFDFTGRQNLMFEVSTQVEQRSTIRARCRDWETFDPHTNMCRPITCSKNYELINNKCEKSKGETEDKNTISSLKQLNLVHQTTVVKIRMNVCVSERDVLNTDKERYRTDLAGILQVDVERMENFKLNFTPGSVPEAIFTYEVLTNERYQELFPPLPSEDNSLVYDSAQAQQVRRSVNAQEENTRDADINKDSDGNSTDRNDNFSDGVEGESPRDGNRNVSEISRPGSESKLGDTPQKDQDNVSDADISPISAEQSSTGSQVNQMDIKTQRIMEIDFVLVPPHNKSDGDSRRLMHTIRELNHRFIFQMENGEITLKETPMPEFTDTSQFCPWGIEHRLQSEEYVVLTDFNGKLMLYVNKTNQYLKMGKFDLFIRMAGDDAANITNVREQAEFAFGCFMPRINQDNCSRISLTRDEYTIHGEQKDLVFEDHTYDVFSYMVENETSGEVQICVPQSFGTGAQAVVADTKWFAVVESCGSSFVGVHQAEALITEILGRVSLVALFFVLLTYLLFPRLRNLPGINTMNLTFALLVAETMFSHGIDAELPWLCTTIAVCLHYLFLAAHFWMNVMSYDVYRTFVSDVSCSMPMKRVKDKKKYVPLYSLYAWGTPLVIVAFCLLVERSDLFPGVSIGYGISTHVGPKTGSFTNASSYGGNISGNPSDIPDLDTRRGTWGHSVNRTDMVDSKNVQRLPVNLKKQEDQNQAPPLRPSQLSYCWITEPLAAFISFGAPILIIFIANCIFFARVITTISRTARLSKSRLQTTRSTSSLNKRQPGRSDAMLYLRMSSVMGFTWIFGLSSSIVSSFSRPAFEICVISHVLGLLFTIFNISQGIFIFGAFVCNRRVLNLYRALLTRVSSFTHKRGSKSNLYVINSSSTLSTLPDATRH